MARSVSYDALGGPTVSLSQTDSGAFTCTYSGADELIGFRTVTSADVALGVPRATVVKPAIVNAVKQSFATPTIETQYSGAALDGVLMASGSLLEPRRITVTTAVSAGTYNTTDPILIGGSPIYLTESDGGETVESNKLTPAGLALTLTVPAQADALGLIEVGVASRTEYEPTDIYPVTVTKTTSAADVVDVAGQIFVQLVHDVSISESLTFGPEQLIAVQQQVEHCRETILNRFEA